MHPPGDGHNLKSIIINGRDIGYDDQLDEKRSLPLHTRPPATSDACMIRRRHARTHDERASKQAAVDEGMSDDYDYEDASNVTRQ